MNLKTIGVALVLGALAGLAASCSQPTAPAAPQAQAETAAPSESAPAPMQAAAQTSSAAPQARALAAGEYEGDFDGAGATVSISGSAPSYNVHLIVGGDGCGGGALGPARANDAGVLTVRPADDARCTITMTPTASGYSVAESGCSNLHGDTCAFNGQVHRKH